MREITLIAIAVTHTWHLLMERYSLTLKKTETVTVLFLKTIQYCKLSNCNNITKCRLVNVL